MPRRKASPPAVCHHSGNKYRDDGMNVDHGSKSGLLTLGSTDILGRVGVCCGAVLCIVGCLAAFLTSPHELPIASPSCDNPKCLQTLLDVPWGTNHSWLKLCLAPGCVCNSESTMAYCNCFKWSSNWWKASSSSHTRCSQLTSVIDHLGYVGRSMDSWEAMAQGLSRPTLH